MGFWTYVIVGGISLIVVSGIRIINQYQNAVRLRLGKYKDTLTAGLKWVYPFGIDSLEFIDLRQRAIGLQSQEVLSKDNVNLSIDGVLFYIVENPQNAFLNVANLEKQLEVKSTAELKDIVGSMTMQEALTERDKIGKELRDRMAKVVRDEGNDKVKKDWGVIVKSIQINDIKLPESLVRAMAKTAEAEREKMARVIKSQGEMDAAQKFKEAAEIYAKFPQAMRLRELQTYQEIGAEHNSLIIVVPEKDCNSLSLAALGKEYLQKEVKKK